MEPIVNSLLCTRNGCARFLMKNRGCSSRSMLHMHCHNPKTRQSGISNSAHDRLINVHISRFDHGKAHFPLDRHASMARVMESLKDHRFNGCLTLEIEDLNLTAPFCRRKDFIACPGLCIYAGMHGIKRWFYLIPPRI